MVPVLLTARRIGRERLDRRALRPPRLGRELVDLALNTGRAGDIDSCESMSQSSGTDCAVLASAKSLAAIGEWASDAPGQVLVPLGVRRDPLTGA